MKNNSPSVPIAFVYIFCLLHQLAAQGLNQITILPESPTTEDSIYIISDLDYFGNCMYGLVGAGVYTSGMTTTIYPTYCGYWDTTFCSSIDTFVVPPQSIAGEHQLIIEYHQGSVCPVSGFDAIIAHVDTTVTIGMINGIAGNLEQDISFTIMPNPVTDLIQIELATGAEIRSLAIYSALGQAIPFDIQNQGIRLSSANPGIYFLLVELADGSRLSRSFIKQ